MKKRLLAILGASFLAGAMFVGCGTAKDDESNKVEELTEDNNDSYTTSSEDDDSASSEDDNESEELPDYETFSIRTDVLPDYEYPGPEAFYSVLYDYVEDFGDKYEDSDVSIPCIRIVDIDESDKSDIKVYGDFYILNYNLSDDTLACASGGDYPGLIHMAMDPEDGDYEVIGFDVVGDGSLFESTAREIYGDKYDDFMAMYTDQDSIKTVRAQTIANYIAANNLDIKYYQDYGWDKVELPEENIDTFYSELE